MVSLQKIVGKMTAVVMTATAILSVLTPSLALAASSYTTTPSTDGVVGTDRGLTIIQYVLDTTAQTWADGDLLTFTLPANFPTFASIGVDPTNYVVEIDDNANRGDGLGMGMALPAGSTNGTYSVTGRVVTVKFNASAWSPTSGISLRVVILSNLIPQYAGTTSVAIGGTTADGLDTDPSGSTSIVTAAAGASGTTVLAANSVVGTAGNTTLTYTLPVALASGATVEFTAPGNLDVSQVVYVSGGAISGCAAVGQVVTCTANGVVTSGGGKTIVMSGIKSWHAATGQTVAVTVKDSSANTLATSTGGVVTDATVGNLTSGGVGFQTNIGEATGSATVTFTSTVTSTLAIPNGGQIAITFPSGFNVTGANGAVASGLSGVNGTWTAAVSGQTVTLTQSGGTTSTAGTMSLTIPNIKNPSATSNTGTFTVLTKDSAGNSVQTGLPAAVSVINVNFGPSPTPTESIPAPIFTPAPAVVTSTSTVATPVVQEVKLPESQEKELEQTPTPAAVQQLLTGVFSPVIAQKSAANIDDDLKTVAKPVDAKCAAGALIKQAGNSAVYYCGADGKRYVFPNHAVYESWYVDFSNIITMTAEQLAAVQLGGMVHMKPGVKMVKLQTDPKVYAVAPNGTLRWISSEALAVKLYGAEWKSSVIDLSDAFLSNYSMGSSIIE